MLYGLDLEEAAKAVQAPTLVCAPEGLRPRYREAVRALAGLVPKARYQEFPGADLLPYGGYNPEFLDLVEEFLTGARGRVSAERVLATVLFTDFVDSTRAASAVGDARWRELLDVHDGVVRREVEANRGRLVKTTGDGILATFDGPARAIQCARGVQHAMSQLGVALRAGLHTGEVEVRGEDVSGLSVVIASRVMDLADPGEVLVSRTVTDLVAGAGIEFEDRGEHELKGVPGAWRIFSVRA
jgi:class 3 adenylate cyclase